MLCNIQRTDDENVQNSGKTSTGVLLGRGVSNEEITGKQIGSRRNANVTGPTGAHLKVTTFDMITNEIIKVQRQCIGEISRKVQERG